MSGTKRPAVGALNERLEVLELRSASVTASSANAGTPLCWEWETAMSKPNLWSVHGIGAAGVTFTLRRQGLTPDHALRWRGQHCLITAIRPLDRLYLSVDAALVVLSRCRDPETGETFPAVMTEEYVRHRQRDEAETAPAVLTQPGQVPAALGKENQDYVRRAFLGYVAPPRQVLVYAMRGEDGLDEALAWMAGQTLDYLCGPADCTAQEAEAIAAWVKARRKHDGAKYKAVLPSCGADDCAVVNFTGTGMTDGTTTWTTAAYCSRIAGLLAGTPMRISATYAPLPELSDCGRLTREESDAAVGAGQLCLRWDGRKVKLDRAVTSLTTTGEGVRDSFKKIKIVEVMDLIRTDVTATAEDAYVGRFANSYDSKLLLVTAIRSYFMGLQQSGLIQADFTVDIDAQA